MQNNHRKGLLIGGLCVALGLAILGTLAIARPKHPSTISTGDLTRLDREAQAHFDKARAEILSGMKAGTVTITSLSSISEI